MTIIDNIRAVLSTNRPLLPQGFKAAADSLRVGLWGRPQSPDYNTATLYASYKSNEVVYACIDVAAQALVDPRPYVERRQSDGTWTEEEMHPANMLLARPNEFYNSTSFLRAAYASMHIFGVFYVEIVRKTPNGPPVALYPLDPGKLKPVLNKDGSVNRYEWRDGDVRVDLPPENVMAWRRPDLVSRWQGVSPLAVALGAISGDTAQTNFINGFFQSGGQPSGILTVKDRTLNQDEAEHLRQGWRAKFDSARGGDRRDIAVLDSNAVYQKVGAGLDEIASEELRSVAETRICMVFNTPPLIIYSYVGLKGATYSNLKEAWAQFWDSKLTPWLKEYRTWLTDQLLMQFEDEALILGERVRFNWDMSQVAALQDDMDAISTRAREEWKVGLITRGQALQAIKIESDDEIDNVYVDGSKRSSDEAEEIGQDIQLLALNGAQIQSLVQIIQSVSARQLAPDAAVTVIRYSFPSIPDEDARGMVSAAASYEIALPSVAPEQPEPPKQLPAPQRKMAVTDAQIKAIDDGKENLAARAQVKVESYLLREYNRFADSASDEGGDDGDRISAIMRQTYRGSIKLAYDDAEVLLAEQQVDIAFNLANPFVKETIDGLMTRVRSITGTTKEDVRGIIAKGLDEGLSTEQIGARIREAAPELSKNRAWTIARTETADAYSRGAILAYQESGVVEQVEWNATLDDKTSQVCQGLHGKRVDLGEAFAGGFAGPPAHPNCRSVLLPITD